MNSSFLYHAWGLYHHMCLCEEYKGNTIILYLQSKESLKCCPKCGHAHFVKNGFRTRDLISHPIGGKKVILRMKVRRYKELRLWLLGTDILCPRQSQLHSSFCKVCGRSIEGDGIQRCSPSLGCIVGHNQGDSHSSFWVSLCSALSIGKNRRERAKCHSWWKWLTRLWLIEPAFLRGTTAPYRQEK